MNDFDPLSPRQIADILRLNNLRPKKRLGQNFLIDRNTLNRILNAADIQPEEPVLEIGAGLGALTRSLSSLSPAVTTIEIDSHLEPILRESLASYNNVRLIHADFLKLDTALLLTEAFGSGNGLAAANIPYYITTPILETLLKNKQKIRRIVMLVQLEYAKRIMAQPDTSDYGAMSLFAQYHAHCRVAGKVPRTVFLPSPEVDSAILVLDPVVPGSIPVINENLFFRLTRAAFGRRRKTLSNSLEETLGGKELADIILDKAGIDSNRRGETLSLEDFARLANIAAEDTVQEAGG